MFEHARFDAPASTADTERAPDANDRSMRLLEWGLSAVALLAAFAITFLR
jgi:hypothetical protein